MKNIVIFGASGHGNVVLDCIEKQGDYTVLGFIDSYKKKGRTVNGYTILGSEFDLPFLIDKYAIVGGIVAIGDNWTRKLVMDRIMAISPMFSFISVIHPSASIGRNTLIGKGTVIMPGAIINSNSRIGDFCIINTNASIDHDGTMENFSSLAPRVCTGGNFSLGAYSAVCLGANIIENIKVADHSIVGAGSLVINNIEKNVVVYGSPSRVIRKRSAGEPYLSGAKKVSVIPIYAKEV
ncbi:acetyltransferase [Maribacter sp.]|uniref:acetyltransferase n=1 Tax=Maribacter sp. TaxID=1897614 RepID=UPI0025BDD449|nr:acetyltransferase [Maribacter sp.]